MDIMKVAMLIETISSNAYTRKYKDYVIHEAVSLGVITEEDAIQLRMEYCKPERCEEPWDYKYTIVYWGSQFEGDVPNDYNEIGCNDLAVWWAWIRDIGEDMEVYVYDNEYGLTYNTAYGEWS